MPSTTHTQGTSVPSTNTPFDHNDAIARREAVDAAARAGMLRSMGPARNTADVTVDQLMQAAFFNGRTPRSGEYKAGTRAVLENRIEHKDIVPPYQAGTTEADAYFAGIEEGKSVWRAVMSKTGGAA